MIKWQEVVTSRCKTNNTRPQTQTWTGFTTHIGDSVQRSWPKGIFLLKQPPTQTLQCSVKYFLSWFSHHHMFEALSKSKFICVVEVSEQGEKLAAWCEVFPTFTLESEEIIGKFVSRRQLTLLDSESNRKWRHGVRSKYIVRPSAVEGVLLVWFLAVHNSSIGDLVTH